MTGNGDPAYTDRCGRDPFEEVLTAYNRWRGGIPYIGPGAAGVEARGQSQLVRDVWPAVERLCVRLEADGNGELASRIERGFRDVEDYARLIDDYCQSDRFDLDLWLYGDPAGADIAPVDESPTALLEQAHAIGLPQEDEDFYHWSQGREWTRLLGERCERIEIEKHGRAPVDEYARNVAYWAWACFWLAVQLRHQKADHHGAYGFLDGYLSSMTVVTETKDLLIHEALGRAYGMGIYPIEPMESEEVLRAIESFGTVVTETQAALAKATRQAAVSGPAAHATDVSVTLVEFMKEYCQDGDKMSPNVLDSRRNSIQNAAQAGTVFLPDNVGNWKTGKSKYYRPGDLAERWDEYCRELPNLPPLKTGGPSPGGQTA